MQPATSLWQFANQIYAAPGVKETCLQVQEAQGVDVCVLLYLLWRARASREISAEELQNVLSATAEWHGRVVQTLRIARRALKGPPALVDPQEAETLRTAVKAVELKAERLQLEGYEAKFAQLGTQQPDVIRAARTNMQRYGVALGLAFPESAVETFIVALQDSAST